MIKNLLIILCFGVVACNGQHKEALQPKSAGKVKTAKSEDEWRKTLTDEQYRILREKGTEAPFSGVYNDHFEKGKYVCAGCGQVLFASDSKFRSDCGWPSFDQALPGSVDYHDDKSYGMSRTEVTCSGCGGHLGHVFDDGPKETTGQRFCTNSVSVKFIPEEK